MSSGEVVHCKCNGRGTTHLEKMPSKTDIMIGLEDEQGELKPVDIDEVDEVITMGTVALEAYTCIMYRRKVST